MIGNTIFRDEQNHFILPKISSSPAKDGWQSLPPAPSSSPHDCLLQEAKARCPNPKIPCHMSFVGHPTWKEQSKWFYYFCSPVPDSWHSQGSCIIDPPKIQSMRSRLLQTKAHNTVLFPADPVLFVLYLVRLQRSKRCKASGVRKHTTKLLQCKQCEWKEQFDLISRALRQGSHSD